MVMSEGSFDFQYGSLEAEAAAPDPRAALRSSRARPGRGIVEAAQKGREAGGCSEAGREGRTRQEGRGKASGRQEVGTEEGKAGEEGEEGEEGREEDRP